MIDFVWVVPEAGFRWERVRPDAPGRGRQWRLTPKPGKRFREYRPAVDERALFRNFADLKPDDRDAILAFANL